jgi:hypothetical protein
MASAIANMIANVEEKERNIKRPFHKFLVHTGHLVGRSFFPLLAIAIIVGTTLWGPWVSLAMTALALSAAMRFS